jgi:endonuclease III related protein
MPSLHDVFSPVSSALGDRSDRPQSDFEDLATPFEAMVAVLLARNLGRVSWKSVLDGLSEAGLLTPDRLANADLIEIADAVRGRKPVPSVKTLAPLKQLASWFVERGDLGDFSVAGLRDALAGLKGIGVAGADAILLFALKQPTYPVDRGSFRIMVRHGWLDSTATYEEARDALIDAAAAATGACNQDQASLLNDLAPALEQVGRTFCRLSAPRCDGCPLESFLPEGGPRAGND